MKRLLALLVIAFSAFALKGDEKLPVIRLFELHSERIPGSEEILHEAIDLRGFIMITPDLEISTLESAVKWTEKTYTDLPISEENTRKTPSAMIHLTPNDAKGLANLTERIRGKRLVIKIGDTVHSAPRVMEPIESGELVLSCSNSEEQEKLVEELKALVNRRRR